MQMRRSKEGDRVLKCSPKPHEMILYTKKEQKIMIENINQRTFVSNFDTNIENPSENTFFCFFMKLILNEPIYAANRVVFIVHFKETR